MLYYGVPTLMFLAVVAALMAAAVIQFINYRLLDIKDMSGSTPQASQAEATLLFDGQILIDATQKGRDLLNGFAIAEHTLEMIGRALDPHFPGLLHQLRTPTTSTSTIRARDQTLGLAEVQTTDGLLRLSLKNALSQETVAHPFLQDEIEILRHLSEESKQLIWRTDNTGAVIWANKAYVSLSDQLAGTAETVATWPPAVLFPEAENAPPSSTPRRCAARNRVTGERAWFDVTGVASSYGRVHFATDASSAVHAEDQMSFFLQTMTKTFSHLSTGLAVFDASRRLVIFNPALLELTKLPVALLSQEPTVQTFLDALRDRTILPEPKDYQLWRDQFLALEADPSTPELNDLWSLPDGQTYRVAVRHHSEGALAFMIEDVSSVMTMTRSLRNEMTIAYATLDALDDAIAVFSTNGTLINSNAKYDQLWAKPASMTHTRVFSKEMAHWRKITAPSGLWSQSFDRLPLHQSRPTFSEPIRRMDDTVHTCSIAPLINGATLVRFGSVNLTKTSQAELAKAPAHQT